MLSFYLKPGRIASRPLGRLLAGYGGAEASPQALTEAAMKLKICVYTNPESFRMSSGFKLLKMLCIL